jgi:hypothetical protein
VRAWRCDSSGLLDSAVRTHLNPGKRLKTNNVIPGIECGVTPGPAAQEGVGLGWLASFQAQLCQALDDLFAFCASRPLSRALLMEWRAIHGSHLPSTIYVRLSAVRKTVGEARRAGMIGQEAASLTDRGKPAGKLADPRAGQRTAGGPRPFDPEKESATTSSGVASRLRPAEERIGGARG